MQQISRKTSVLYKIVFIGLTLPFIVLATLKSNTMFLAPAFLLCGISFYKSANRQPLKSIGLFVCIAFALAAIGYSLGKDAGIRDRSLNSAQAAGAWSNNSFKPKALRSTNHMAG